MIPNATQYKWNGQFLSNPRCACSRAKTSGGKSQPRINQHSNFQHGQLIHTQTHTVHTVFNSVRVYIHEISSTEKDSRATASEKRGGQTRGILVFPHRKAHYSVLEIWYSVLSAVKGCDIIEELLDHEESSSHQNNQCDIHAESRRVNEVCDRLADHSPLLSGLLHPFIVIKKYRMTDELKHLCQSMKDASNKAQQCYEASIKSRALKINEPDGISDAHK